MPVAAALVLILGGSLLGALGKTPADLAGDAGATWAALVVLGNGFILTALLWAWALVAILESRAGIAAVVLAVASLAALCGVIHSPLPNGALFWPWSAPDPITARIAGAYGVAGAVCWLAVGRQTR